MNRNERIKEIADKIYNDYITNGWKNVSLKDCELKAINYIDTEIIVKNLSLSGVVATLPNINSNVFKNWLKVNKYAETMNRLVYSKKDWDYDIDVLYRAFTNEIEFGN